MEDAVIGSIGALKKENVRVAIDSLIREFQRFDNEREAWEFEKSELEARLAHYEKEAKTQEREKVAALERMNFVESQADRLRQQLIEQKQQLDEARVRAAQKENGRVPVKKKRGLRTLRSSTLPTSFSKAFSAATAAAAAADADGGTKSPGNEILQEFKKYRKMLAKQQFFQNGSGDVSSSPVTSPSSSRKKSPGSSPPSTSSKSALNSAHSKQTLSKNSPPTDAAHSSSRSHRASESSESAALVPPSNHADRRRSPRSADDKFRTPDLESLAAAIAEANSTDGGRKNRSASATEALKDIAAMSPRSRGSFINRASLPPVRHDTLPDPKNKQATRPAVTRLRDLFTPVDTNGSGNSSPSGSPPPPSSAGGGAGHRRSLTARPSTSSSKGGAAAAKGASSSRSGGNNSNSKGNGRSPSPSTAEKSTSSSSGGGNNNLSVKKDDDPFPIGSPRPSSPMNGDEDMPPTDMKAEEETITVRLNPALLREGLARERAKAKAAAEAKSKSRSSSSQETSKEDDSDEAVVSKAFDSYRRTLPDADKSKKSDKKLPMPSAAAVRAAMMLQGGNEKGELTDLEKMLTPYPKLKNMPRTGGGNQNSNKNDEDAGSSSSSSDSDEKDGPPPKKKDDKDAAKSKKQRGDKKVRFAVTTEEDGDSDEDGGKQNSGGSANFSGALQNMRQNAAKRQRKKKPMGKLKGSALKRAFAKQDAAMRSNKAAPSGSGGDGSSDDDDDEFTFPDELVDLNAKTKTSASVADSKPESKFKPFAPLMTLKSHLDGVRSAAFYEKSAVLLTGSEDGTARLWDLRGSLQTDLEMDFETGSSRAASSRKSGSEPVRVYRGHESGGMITSVCVDSEYDRAITTGVDGQIMVWAMPDFHSKGEISCYSTSGNNWLHLQQHFADSSWDAYWDMALCQEQQLLFAANANGFVQLLNLDDSVDEPLIQRYEFSHPSSGDMLTPSSVCVEWSDGGAAAQPDHLLVGYTTGHLVQFDIETAKPVTVMSDGGGSNAEPAPNDTERLIYEVASLPHNEQRLSFAACNDHRLRFFDTRQEKCVDSMLAHTDAVSAVAVIPENDCVVTASHDSSIRFWCISTRRIFADVSAHQTHRKKHDEGTHCLAHMAYEPKFGKDDAHFVASGGADSLIRIYEEQEKDSLPGRDR